MDPKKLSMMSPQWFRKMIGWINQCTKRSSVNHATYFHETLTQTWTEWSMIFVVFSQARGTLPSCSLPSRPGPLGFPSAVGISFRHCFSFMEHVNWGSQNPGTWGPEFGSGSSSREFNKGRLVLFWGCLFDIFGPVCMQVSYCMMAHAVGWHCTIMRSWRLKIEKPLLGYKTGVYHTFFSKQNSL